MKMETGKSAIPAPNVNTANKKKSEANRTFLLPDGVLDVRKDKVSRMNRCTVKFPRAHIVYNMFSADERLNSKTVTGINKKIDLFRLRNFLKKIMAMPASDKLPINERTLKFTCLFNRKSISDMSRQ